MSDDTAIIGLSVVMATAAIASGLITWNLTNESWRDQIVQHHGAEYYLDANHERQWRWNDEKPSVEIQP